MDRALQLQVEHQVGGTLSKLLQRLFACDRFQHASSTTDARGVDKVSSHEGPKALWLHQPCWAMRVMEAAAGAL